jgi:hypothetical protein
MPLVGRWLFACVAFIVLTTALPAAAESDPKDEAKDLADRAYTKFREGAYDEAIALFQQAEALSHSPVILSFVAQAYENLGKLIEAQQQYTQIVDEQLPEDAKPDHLNAQKRARRQVPILERSIPRLRLRISGLDPGSAEVSLDGRRLSAAELARPIAVNPGERQVVVAAQGYAPIERFVTASERQLSEVELVLATREVTAQHTTASGDDMRWVPTTIAYGVGVSGLLLAIVAGGVYFDRASELESLCPSGRCAPELESNKDTIETVGVAALVGLGIAALGAGVGTTLYLLEQGDDPQAKIGIRASADGAFLVGSF